MSGGHQLCLVQVAYHLYSELQAAVKDVVIVAHAALHHLHLLVPVVADGEWLGVTGTPPEETQQMTRTHSTATHPVCMKRWWWA